MHPEATYLLTRSWERLLLCCFSKTLDAKTVALYQRRRWFEDPIGLSFKGTGVERDCHLLLPSKCNIVTPRLWLSSNDQKQSLRSCSFLATHDLFSLGNQNRETFKTSFILNRVSASQRGDTRICVVKGGFSWLPSITVQLCVKPAITLRRRTPQPLNRHHSDLFLTRVCQKVCLIYYASSQFYSWTARRSLTVGLCYLGGQTDSSNTGSFHCWVALAKLRLNSAQCITSRQRAAALPVHSLQQIIQLIWKKEKRSIRCVFSLFIFSYTLLEFHKSAVAAWTQSSVSWIPFWYFQKISNRGKAKTKHSGKMAVDD